MAGGPTRQPGSSADGRLGSSAYQDGYPVCRRGPHPDLGEVVYRPLMPEGLAGPRPGQNGEDLLHRRAPLGAVGSECFELDPTPSQTQPQGEPTATDQTHRRRILGQAQRVM